MDVVRQDRELTYKQTADKIRQILSKVRETPRSSYKRWIWELMQNAKDVKDPAFGSVSIKVVLDEDTLIYSHNGLPFEVRHLLGIVKQVSTKSSSSEDEEVTGKFGTGFIVTHLLSDSIDIQGYIHDENGSYFRLQNLHLDRSGQSSEELIPMIEQANEYILKVENDRTLFPLVENYKQNKTKDDFDTVFTYKLNSERKREAAKEGIADLKNTLPITLASVEEIGEVIIEDKTTGSLSTYQITDLGADGNVKMLQVKLQGGEDRNYLKFLKEDFCLIAEVSDFDTLALVKRSKDQPVLYRDFPLIGSEKFYFPFILNGYEFNPTEDRNDIVLVNEESRDVLSNRTILEASVDGVIEFIEYLISKNARNRYLCALSRIPQLTVALEDGVAEWFQALQKKWREQLIKLELVETESGNYKSLENVRIPNYGGKDEQKQKFHELVADFLGKDVVPKSDETLSWIEITGPKSEIDAWQVELWYELEDLLKDLQELENLDALGEKVKKPIQWLNCLYAFIHDVKEVEIYDDYKIVPNHQGTFHKLEALYLEDEESIIDDSFLDILETIGENWRDDLVHREVKLSGITTETKGLSDVSKAINDILGKKVRNPFGVDEYIFKKRNDSLSIIIEILRNIVIKETSDFRNKVFNMGRSLFGFEEQQRIVRNINDFQFTISLRLFIECMNKKIEESESITGLAEQLGKNTDEAVFWLNDYYHLLLNKEDFKTLIEYGNIVPNRDGIFCAYEDIYAFGTEETPLDDQLIVILHQLDQNQNWREELIYDGISIKLEPRKFEELGSSVDDALKELEKEETLNPGSLYEYKQPIYELIDWCRLNKTLAEKYLKHTVARSNDLWVKFSMTPEIMSVIRDPKSLDLLQKISDANLSESDKEKVFDLVIKVGSLSEQGKGKLMEKAQEILEDERDFQFKKEVGEKVETQLKSLFETEFPIYEIKYVGKGAYDFLITNPSNQKKYSIELKSIKAQHMGNIKMAISQARYAHQNPDNYALLVIIRPKDYEQLTDEYFLNNLKCVYQIGFNVQIPVKNSHTIETILESHDSIKLSVEDPTMKIYIRQEYIEKVGKPFDSLKMKVHESIK